MSSPDILVEKFEHYFRHPDTDHEVLSKGDHSTACGNVRKALRLLDLHENIHVQDDDLFDSHVEAAVRKFQNTYKHRVSDGCVGPGTRRRLVAILLSTFDPEIFLRMTRPDDAKAVFLSYSREDEDKVAKLTNWLRNKGIRVYRDQTDFVAGEQLSKNIRRSVAASDKTLAVYSANSKSRDWPRFERGIAEDLEARLGSSVLIYLCLDDEPLPTHDPHRLAIQAAGRKLKEFGQDILHAVRGDKSDAPEEPVDEEEVW